MTIKIRIILPAALDTDKPQRKLSDLLPFQDAGVTLSYRHNTFASTMGLSETDHAFAFPGMALAAIEAEKDGMDAIVIESMGDTAIYSCREVVTIPVIGIGQVAMHTACILGNRFAMLIAGHWQGIYLERLARTYGLQDRYVVSQSIEQTPYEGYSTKAVQRKTLHAAMTAVKNHAVDTILLGGSYFIGQGTILSAQLKKAGYDIIVIDPLVLGIRYARAIVECGLTHSKMLYPAPPVSIKIMGYPGISSTPGVFKAKSRKKRAK